MQDILVNASGVMKDFRVGKIEVNALRGLDISARHGMGRRRIEETTPWHDYLHGHKGAAVYDAFVLLFALAAKADQVRAYAFFLLRSSKPPRPSKHSVAGSGMISTKPEVNSALNIAGYIDLSKALLASSQ